MITNVNDAFMTFGMHLAQLGFGDEAVTVEVSKKMFFDLALRYKDRLSLHGPLLHVIVFSRENIASFESAGIGNFKIATDTVQCTWDLINAGINVAGPGGIKITVKLGDKDYDELAIQLRRLR